MFYKFADNTLNTIKRRHITAFWTLIFAVIAFFSFLYFLIEGKTFVIAGDGMAQHLTALTYYGELIRSYIKGVISSGFKDLALPQWDLSLGFGSDIITTLHYYVIGEPLTLLSAFVPKEHTKELYTVLILLRIYLAGLAFLAYCRFHKYNALASFCGAVIYTFCGFTFYCAVRHPYFMTPMIYLPLLCMGIDKILKKESFLFFAFFSFLACASSFYFFYMLTFAIFAYALIRFFCTFPKSEWSTVFRYILPCVLGYILGICMAAALFFPQIYGFLFSARNGQAEYYPLLYRPMYYLKGILSFVAPPTFASYSVLGFAAPALPLVLFSVLRKDKIALQLRIAFGISIVILIFPALAYALNGFKAVTNRWLFIVAFPVAISAIHGLQCLFSDEKNAVFSKRWQQLLIFCTALSFIVLVAATRSEKVRSEFALSYVALLVSATLFFLLYVKQKMQKYAVLILSIVILSAIANATVRYAPWGLDYTVRFLTNDRVYDILAENTFSVPDNTDKNIWRIDTMHLKNGNSPSIAGFYGTTYYWAMNNQNLATIYTDLFVSQSSDMRSAGFAYEPTLSALFNVKYAPIDADFSIPFGFSKSANSAEFLKNDLFVPFGVAYNDTIAQSDFAALSALDKRCALFSYAVVPDSFADLPPTYKGETYATECRFSLSTESGITASENSFSISDTNAKITVSFEKEADALYYLCIKNLSYATDIHDGTNLIAEINGKRYVHEINAIEDITGHDFLFFLGDADSIALSFGEEGHYSFDEITVQHIATTYIKDSIEAMQQHTLKSSFTSKNAISGTIQLEQPEILCLSVVYASGWSAQIDGNSAKLFQTQSGLTGLFVPAGEHTITFSYKTPFFFAGILVAFVAWVIFIILLLWGGGKKRKYKKAENRGV